MNVSKKYYTDTVEGLRERVGFLLAELDEARSRCQIEAEAADRARARVEAAEAEVARLRGLLGEWLRTGETSGGYTLRQRTTAALAAPTKEDS
jgi:hypothetical protein